VGSFCEVPKGPSWKPRERAKKKFNPHVPILDRTNGRVRRMRSLERNTKKEGRKPIFQTDSFP
jgi:hypothetical protein